MNRMVLSVGTLAGIGAVTGIVYLCGMSRREQKEMENKTVDAVEGMNNNVQLKADQVKVASAEAANKVSSAFEDAQEKEEHIRKSLNDGYKRIKKDIHKTQRNISKDFKHR